MNKRIFSIILSAAITVAVSAAAVSAEDAGYAKGVKFTAESGYTANTYTGYIGGVEFDTTAGELMDALVNRNGISIARDNGEKLQHGDKLVLKNEAGETVSDFTVIFMGNADGDNKFNLNDISSAMRSIAGWDTVIDGVAADVNGDGNVNLSDVSLMLQVIAKWDTAFVKEPVLPGKGNAKTSRAIATFEVSEQSNINLKRGNELGVKFSVGEGEQAMAVKAVYPSWADNEGELTLSIFKWAGDYESTVAGMPIKSVKLVNLNDCAEYVFDLTDTAGKGLGEGEYMWLCHEGFDDNEPGGIGLWTYAVPAADSEVEVFYDGKPADFGPDAYVIIGTEN